MTFLERVPRGLFRSTLLSLNVTMIIFVGVLCNSTGVYGQTWKTVPVSTTDGEELSVAHDSEGNVVTLWVSYPKIVYSRSSDQGNSWATTADIRPVTAGSGIYEKTPVVATDDNGLWVALWSSNYTGEGTPGDYDIWGVRSTDAGQTWSEPFRVNSNFAVDAGDDTAPWLAATDNGSFVAVWSSTNTGDGSGTGNSTIFTSTSTDGGLTWSAAVQLSQPDSLNHSHPQIVIDGNGQANVIWAGHNSANTSATISFSTRPDSGAGWSSPISIGETTAPYSMRGSLATDTSGSLVAAWVVPSEGSGTDVCFTKSSDFGASWADPEVIRLSGTQVAPYLVHNGFGSWAIGYEDHSGGFDSNQTARVVVSTDSGNSWQMMQPLPQPPAAYSTLGDCATPICWAYNPENWHALYMVRGSLESVIHAETEFYSLPPVAGEWETPKLFGAPAGITFSSPPSLDNNGGETWIAVYATARTNVEDDSEIMISRSENDGITWSNPQPLNQDWTIDTENDSDPVIAASADGKWLALWRRGSKFMFSSSADNGVSWGAHKELLKPDLASITGSMPDVAFLGGDQWGITYKDDAGRITYCSWEFGSDTCSNPATLVSDSASAPCGLHTSCWERSYRSPKIAANPATGRRFIGLVEDYWYRRNRTEPIESTTSNLGYGANEGTGFAKILGAGSSMASDMTGKWLSTEQNVLYRSINDGESFSAIPLEQYTGRTNQWTKVDVSGTNDWVRLIGVEASVSATSTVQALLVAESRDAGLTWTPEERLDILVPDGATISNAVLKANAAGTFLALWVVKLPGAAQQIYYSRLVKTPTADIEIWEQYEKRQAPRGLID